MFKRLKIAIFIDNMNTLESDMYGTQPHLELSVNC